MSFEKGGRADKFGNRYELRWAIFQILNVLGEELDYVTIEPVGEDEEGVDLWTCDKNGIREGQQCKARNGANENWTYSDVSARGIFEKWKFQLDRDKSHTVALVSPLNFMFLKDLTLRAKNSNANPRDFYHYQVRGSGKRMQESFETFCKEMGLHPANEKDLIKCISYLKRISIHQWSGPQLKKQVLMAINGLLIGNAEDIYDQFVGWIIDGEVYGKKIDQKRLYAFLKSKNITLRNLANDERVMPRLEELNREYREGFIPLRDGFLTRKIFAQCRHAIESGNSIIVHGKAGSGKSGCTVDIIEFCEQNHIPYLAVKLDTRIPRGSSEIWGEQLGLPASISHCIHSISQHGPSVLILDQLDALRWTQAHTREALSVCTEIINEVKNLNSDRKHKISIVLVCRTYDLENDASIRQLFEVGSTSDSRPWTKILVDELEEEVVEEIVGESYADLTSRLKDLLRVPSNLYIWQQLDPSLEYVECSTVSDLVSQWWKQLSRNWFDLGGGQEKLNAAKEAIVEHMESRNRMHAPKSILGGHEACLEYLSSNGFLVFFDNKVSFAHQSLLDCFLAENMLKRYYQEHNIVDIIGDKNIQTPARRYQVQIFMENLYQNDSQDFLYVGQRMFEAPEIRYSFKYVFLEVLSQADVLDEYIQDFILSFCEDQIYGEHLLNSVIFSRPNYIRLLRKHGVLDRWMNDPQKRDVVFNLLVSMGPEYDIDDLAFIERIAFRSEDDDEKLLRCFLYGKISEDSEQLFELRMKFYSHYPHMAYRYHDFKVIFKQTPLRGVRLLRLLLESQTEDTVQEFSIDEDSLPLDNDYLKDNGMEIVDLLLPCVPQISDKDVHFSDWSGRYASSYKGRLQRACIQILKQTNAAVISEKPEAFLDRYKEIMVEGNLLLNEVILDALYHLPEQYSDFVVHYLSSDFEKNAFDRTSGNDDELLLTKQALSKHSKTCSEHSFSELEEKIIKYISPSATDVYRGRINFKRENGYPVYWSFWGEFQKELLEALPSDRLSNRAQELLRVLYRKFPEGTTCYKYSLGHFGWVGSPIAGKKISDRAWLSLLTNKQLKEKQNRHWKEVPGGFIESSIEQFASSFRAAVSEEPERMIRLTLECKQDEHILDVYVDALFLGVAFSKALNDVPTTLLEELILRFSYDHTSRRAGHICSIIEKRATADWSQDILDALTDIALHHEDPKEGNPNVRSDNDKEMRSFDMLQTNALNCVRGEAARAIGSLLWEKKSLFEQFKGTIQGLVVDENPAVKFASLFALWPSYNIDRDWASEVIMSLYEADYRLAGFHDTRQMLFRLYPRYGQRVLKIIEKCYESEDKDLVTRGAHCLSEMNIRFGKFNDVMSDVTRMYETQAKAILNMAVLYVNKDEFSSIAKELILKFKTTSLDVGHEVSKLFYDDLIDLRRDKDFLIEILNSDLSPRLVHSFVRYLEKKAHSVIDYSEIILSMSYSLIEHIQDRNRDFWGLEHELSKLVARLYDETSALRDPQAKRIAMECLDIWDMMFKKRIGSARRLSRELMER